MFLRVDPDITGGRTNGNSIPPSAVLMLKVDRASLSRSWRIERKTVIIDSIPIIVYLILAIITVLKLITINPIASRFSIRSLRIAIPHNAKREKRGR